MIKNLDDVSQRVGTNYTVGVDKKQVFSASNFSPQVSSSSGTRPAAGGQEPGLEGTGQRISAIGGAVVNHNQFPIGINRLVNGFKTVSQLGLVIVNWNDDRQKWFSHMMRSIAKFIKLRNWSRT